MFLIVKELVKGEVVKGAKAPNAARQARRLIRKGPVRVALAEEKEKKWVGVGEGGPKTLHISRGGAWGGINYCQRI